MPLTVEQKSEAELLWYDGELSAANIAKKFGVTKNVIIGVAQRGKWKKRRGPPVKITTFAERMDAIDARFAKAMADV